MFSLPSNIRSQTTLYQKKGVELGLGCGFLLDEVAAATPHLPVVYTDTKEYEEHVKDELGCTDFPMLVVQLGAL